MSRPGRKPLAFRLKASALLLLIEGLLLAIVGFFVVAVPPPRWQPWDAAAGARLPPRDSLSVAEGRVLELAYHVARRRQYVRPTVGFRVEGRDYQVRTLASYQPSLLPFRGTDQPARVLYRPGRPQEAWIEWEYDALVAAKDGTSSRLAALVESAKAGYARLALGVWGLSALLLAVTLFVPLPWVGPRRP